MGNFNSTDKCPYKWPLRNGGYIDRSNEARCLSYIPLDINNPNGCSLNCKDDPCENSFDCFSCHTDPRCVWSKYVFVNETETGEQVTVPYGICEFVGAESATIREDCMATEVLPYPSVFGAPKDLILPRALTSCIAHCAKDADLNASPYHKQVLKSDDYHVESLVFVDTIGQPDENDISGVVRCVSYCVDVQVWPNNIGDPNIFDLTPHSEKKRKRNLPPNSDSHTTTVLSVSVRKGPEVQTKLNDGQVTGVIVGATVFVIVVCIVIIVGVVIVRSYYRQNSALAEVNNCDDHF